MNDTDTVTTTLEWREEWVPGITIDGVWIPADILGELADRPQNTEVTYQDPLLVNPDLKRVLVNHGLAQAQTRGGIYAGEQFKEFWNQLEWTSRPGRSTGWV